MTKKHLTCAAAFFGSIITASTQLSIPSDGSDGALNITANTVIDLSQAVTGTWNQNNSANAGKGVYDPEKWAVVFKYSSVTINGQTGGTPSQLIGRTVTFKNHPSHAPVVWLVQGGVNIAGQLVLKGADAAMDAVSQLLPVEGGPGGFRGGAMGPLGVGAGYGPSSTYPHPGNGTYASVYGNPQIIPLIGGSGTTADYQPGTSTPTYPSAGAGGAILIATSGTMSITGVIDASGGSTSGYHGTRYGSGGAIRLIAANIAGTTNVALGVTSNLTAFPDGRIRVEGSLSPTIVTTPETIGVAVASSPIIWPAANAPKARVVSVDAILAPTDPTSPLIAAADVAIQNNAPVNILIETRDFPIEGVVQVAVIPKFGNRSWLPATRISGGITQATWRVTTVLPQGFVTLQARATQP